MRKGLWSSDHVALRGELTHPFKEPKKAASFNPALEASPECDWKWKWKDGTDTVYPDFLSNPGELGI